MKLMSHGNGSDLPVESTYVFFRAIATRNLRTTAAHTELHVQFKKSSLSFLRWRMLRSEAVFSPKLSSAVTNTVPNAAADVGVSACVRPQSRHCTARLVGRGTFLQRYVFFCKQQKVAVCAVRKIAAARNKSRRRAFYRCTPKTTPMAKNSTLFEKVGTPTTLTPKPQTLRTILAFAVAYHAEAFNGKQLQFILN